MGLEPYLLILLLSLSGFFSASETAFTSLSLMQIKEFARRKAARAKLLEKMYHTPERIITTILVGNNIVNTSIATLTTLWVSSLAGNFNIGILTGAITMIILIFGEVTPKQIAINYNLSISVFAIPILYSLSFVFFPINWVLSLVTNFIKLFSKTKGRNVLTVDGLLHLVNHAESLGLVKGYEGRMVRSVFRFSEVTARTVMTHRTEVFSLHRDDTLEHALKALLASGYSRAAVHDGDYEHIVGVLSASDLLRLSLENPDQFSHKLVSDLMQKPVFVSEQWNIPRVFSRLYKEKTRLGIVLDEYGGLAGIITVSDLLNQLLVDMHIENTDSELRFKKTADGDYHIPGDEPFYVVEELAGIELDSIAPDVSIAAYLEESFGEIPDEGRIWDSPIGRFTIYRKKGTRILEVLFSPATTDDLSSKIV